MLGRCASIKGSIQASFFLCYDQAQQASRAISVCSEVLKSNPANVNVLKDRAEAYLQDEQYEEGKPDICSCIKVLQDRGWVTFCLLAGLTWEQ